MNLFFNFNDCSFFDWPHGATEGGVSDRREPRGQGQEVRSSKRTKKARAPVGRPLAPGKILNKTGAAELQVKVIVKSEKNIVGNY